MTRTTAPQAKATRGPTSLAEEARLTGEFADWHNLFYDVSWLAGPLNVAALRDAWWRVCMRHDVMRRTYVSADEACTYAEALSEPEFHTADSDGEAIETMHGILGIPFDLSGPGFSRIVVVQRDENRHLLGIAVDHIISDQISWSRLCTDFLGLYERALAGDLGDTTEQGTYRAFATRLRHDFPDAWGRKRREFWRSYTAEFGTFPPLFSAGTRHTGELCPKVIRHELPADARSRVQAFSLRAGATPFAVAASGLLTGMREVTGDPVTGLTTNHHGRITPSTSRTIGLFTQTVPLHLGGRHRTAVEVVRDVFHQSLDVSEYMVPLRVAGNSWAEKLMAPDRPAGVFVRLDESASPSSSALALAGTVGQHVPMTFPGEKRTPETVAVTWYLYETNPHISVSYNENFFPAASVEQLVRSAGRFAMAGDGGDGGDADRYRPGDTHS